MTIETIEMDSREAFGIVLRNRLDFMNGRAALVDSWRQIQVNADALQSVLNVTAVTRLVCPTSVRRACRERISQSLIVLSQLTPAKVYPSGLTATAITPPG